MWHFAIGLYLVFLSNQSLRLAAVYGFSVGGSILLFGGVVGNWVDKNGRLQGKYFSYYILSYSNKCCVF